MSETITRDLIDGLLQMSREPINEEQCVHCNSSFCLHVPGKKLICMGCGKPWQTKPSPKPETEPKKP